MPIKSRSSLLIATMSEQKCGIVTWFMYRRHEMLERLDETYGDPRKIVDSIISEIIQYRKPRDGDKQSLIKFIDLLERALADLSKMNLEAEMSTTNIISMIESKLPNNISMEWYRHIYKSGIDKRKPFPPLLDFLKTERSALEYSMSKTKTSYEENQFSNMNINEKYQYTN